jgi:hypothetical protein
VEKNTFSVSTYIAAPMDSVYGYLADLQNLNEWTLFSRMTEKVDEDTWLGTASGYQKKLYYHIRRRDNGRFKGVEWHCGFEHGDYFQVYPTFLFPPGYLEPGSDEAGAYFHWVSFVDPARRTAMIEQGLSVAHTAECRSLKAVLERKAGHTRAARGRYTVRSSTIYVDAPWEAGAAYIADPQQMSEWAYLLKLQRSIGPGEAEFHDEYGNPVTIATRTHKEASYAVIEQDTRYEALDLVQRAPAIVMPCSYALGNPQARGFMLQRLSFWKNDAPPEHGRLQMEDYAAELINIKRILEGRAGNKDTFSLGPSYVAPAQER